MLGELRVLLEEDVSFIAGDGDEAEVAEIGHGEVGEAGLTGAEKAARTAELEVGFGQLETIGSFFESGESSIFA